jgi:hypothetical protein
MMAYDRIVSGQAKRILAGSTSDSGPYIGEGLMLCAFVLLNIMICLKRLKTITHLPLFVPGSGAGAMVDFRDCNSKRC